MHRFLYDWFIYTLEIKFDILAVFIFMYGNKDYGINVWKLTCWILVMMIASMYLCMYMTLGFMFRHEFLEVMILTLYAHVYVFIAKEELRLHKRVVSINYLLRVVLDFNSVVFMFYFNWIRVTDYCILLIIDLLILESTSPKVQDGNSAWNRKP
jgi:hypothetical protein